MELHLENSYSFCKFENKITNVCSARQNLWSQVAMINLQGVASKLMVHQKTFNSNIKAYTHENMF